MKKITDYETLENSGATEQEKIIVRQFFKEGIIDVIVKQINNEIKILLDKDSEEITSAKTALNGLEIARNNLIDTIEKIGYNQILTERQTP